MSENINREIYTELANRIYDLDAEVYRVLGSSLGRTFTGNRDTTIRTLSMLMYTKPDGHLLRSELALISNMARTIKDPAEKSRLMTEYDEILKAIEQLPNMFGSTDILDAERAALNLAVRREKISENDHLVICISRTQGSAGNDIGFELADKLRINYYDVEIFDQVMKRLEAEKDNVQDKENFTDFNKYGKKTHESLKTKLKELNRYHGLSKQDAVFFNMSDLICELARTEDCLIMGRCADAILKNNHIPHISIFISAPFQVRTQHVMDVRNMDMKQAVRFLKKMDKQHKKYYEFYTGEKWGKPDFCCKRLFVYINIAVQRVLGNTEIISYFIAGFCNQKSTGIIQELDCSHLVFFVHQSYWFSDQSYGFFNQMIQQIIDTVGDLFWLFFLINGSDQSVQCTFDHGQLCNIIVDSKYIMQGAIIVADIGSTAF